MVRTVLLLVLCMQVVPTSFAQSKYKDFQDAYTQGANHVRAGRLADAREPLEAAVELAKTPRDKLDAHRALLHPYRELQEVGPMRSSAEYLITNGLPGEQSLTRMTLLSFLNKRGKLAESIKTYEEKLKTSPDDRVALLILTEAYGRFQNDPKPSAEFGKQLIALDEKQKIKPNVMVYADIARQMVLAGQEAEGANLYEKLTALDASTEAWYWKEAAQAWQKTNDKVKALTAAKKSLAAKPEKRSEQLTYYWRRQLGDLFLLLDKPAEAVTQLEEALKHTKIQGYLDETKAKLAQAKSAAGK